VEPDAPYCDEPVPLVLSAVPLLPVDPVVPAP
jgi:hypothetical protein